MEFSTSRHEQFPQTPPESAIELALLKTPSAEIVSFLKSSRDSVSLRGVQQPALAYLLARAARQLKNNILVVAPTDREAEKLSESLSFFLGRNHAPPESPLERRVWNLPSRAGRKTQSLGKMETVARRIEALYALRSSASPVLAVTSALALLERLIPPEVLAENADYKVAGEEVDLDAFCRKLVSRGFYRVSLVEEYGDFSRRGGVVDIYAPLYRWPLRLEFFGDELESIRLFHPISQRSLGTLEDAVILPGSEIVLDDATRERAQKAVYEDVRSEVLTPAAGNVWLDRLQEGHQLGVFESVFPVFYDRPATIWDYLDRGGLIVWTDAAQIHREMEEQYRKALQESSGEQSPHEWKRPPEELFEEPEKVWAGARDFQQVLASSLGGDLSGPAPAKIFDMGASGNTELALAIKSHASRERLLEPLAAQFRKWIDEAISIFLVCQRPEQAKRIAELLAGYGVAVEQSKLPFGEESFEAATVKVVSGPLQKGFVWPAERIAVVSEEEIFGRRRQRNAAKPVSGLFLSSFEDLRTGDFVVHVDHGIGVYKELAHLAIRGLESDFLLLEYQDGDRLYVPVDKLQRVQKYLGIEGQEPKVDKLGGKTWEAAKSKARESAEKMAGELLDLYAMRQVGGGFSFSAPDQYFQEFETTFAFEETPDQIKAIDDVLDDMAAERPMDRLICGDVGYGKTEVAIRAAFKAVMDGKQVAILVPTTVLAEQHYESFRERFGNFPVTVASLSRFKSGAGQKQVLEGLRKGGIDIVIGTHRLLQKDVVFKDLGLLVIDEEHRFGVKHKERLKSIRVSVDVLTLTATPIPRTLHMALAGIRDLSTIETPPEDRHAIETFVCGYDEVAIREAIYRELHRNGQVFFVHNHVNSIYQMASQLGRLVPEARVAIAHGQMKERDLEKVMLDFIHHKIDVLVCTTIIESGLDIPAANTIIINRADRFGLAQIYQLRGRVGRSSEQAYAYLIIPGEHLITRDAQKRLRALLDFSELGAGFKIALNDLQIRGGGTILGSAQSGHIAAIGYELYLELLEKAIRGIKGEDVEAEQIEPEINVSISAFLPESFIPDTDQRLLAYKRLSTLAGEPAVDDLAGEWRDRFGPFPDSVKHLLLLAKMRLTLKRFGIGRMDGGAEHFTLHFAPKADPGPLVSFLEEKKCTCVLESERKLKVEIWGRHFPHRLVRLKKIFQELEERTGA
jgi:transcription-repair coupling factor (superfamily II helicase)